VVCRKVFPSSVLPEPVAEQLAITEISPGAAASGWKEEERRCRAQFGRRGEFDSLAPSGDVSVGEVTRLAGFRPAQGITDAARVRLRQAGDRAT